MTVINLMELDRVPGISKLYDQYRDALIEYLRKTPEKKLALEIWAPSIKYRKPNGEPDFLDGARVLQEDGQLTIDPRYHTVTEALLRSPGFPPSLGVTMGQYLEREAKNAKQKDKRLHEEHPTSLLNDGVTRIVPLRVGTVAEFAAKRISSEILSDLSVALFGVEAPPAAFDEEKEETAAEA